MSNHRRGRRRWLDTLDVRINFAPVSEAFMPPLRYPIISAAVAIGLVGIPYGVQAQSSAPSNGPIATSPLVRTQSPTGLALPSLGVQPATSNEPQSTLLEADTIERGESDDIIIATGNVTSRAQGRTIRADKIIYNQRTGIVNASEIGRAHV